MKTVLLMTISADGYIARVNDEAPWSPEEFARCNAFTEVAGNIVVGRRTYEIMNAAGDFNDRIETVVLSRQPSTDTERVHFAASPREAVEYLKGKGFSMIVVGGGTMTNTAFLEEGLLDEIMLDIEPMVLGEGLPLFSKAIHDERLRLMDIEDLDSNAVRIRYSVLR